MDGTISCIIRDHLRGSYQVCCKLLDKEEKKIKLLPSIPSTINLESKFPYLMILPFQNKDTVITNTKEIIIVIAEKFCTKTMIQIP